MSKISSSELLIGAHTSAAGGVHKALLQGQEIGATTIQLFTSNQKQWAGKVIPEDEVKRWNDCVEATQIKKIMSHDSYLINLGSSNPEILAKSRQAFKEELQRCHQLQLTYLNFHPGAATDKSEEECLNTIVASLEELEEPTSRGPTTLLLEATAGQGTSVGHRFEHLGYLIQRLHPIIPIGVCIDTCHIFAAGYDIRTPEGWDQTLKEFDEKVGLQYLHAFHVNDSMKPFASRRDRHAQLGEGEMGLDCFKAMMAHPKLREIPKYLETPDPLLWKKEIQLLRDFS